MSVQMRLDFYTQEELSIQFELELELIETILIGIKLCKV